MHAHSTATAPAIATAIMHGVDLFIKWMWLGRSHQLYCTFVVLPCPSLLLSGSTAMPSGEHCSSLNFLCAVTLSLQAPHHAQPVISLPVCSSRCSCHTHCHTVCHIKECRALQAHKCSVHCFVVIQLGRFAMGAHTGSVLCLLVFCPAAFGV